MAYWTLNQVRTKIEEDIDLEEDTIVQPAEFIGYVNDAVREVVDEMQRMGVEDQYYRIYAPLPLTQGVKEYNFPADIFKNKITELVYDNGAGDIYNVRKIKGQDIYRIMHERDHNASTNDLLAYTIFNFGPLVGDKIRISPTPRKNYPTELTIYYIRQAVELSRTDDGTGLVDCPEEFINFVIAYVKWKCTGKEIGNPMYTEYKEEASLMRSKLSASLTGQVEDGDNKLPMDTSIYGEHV